MLDLVGAFEDKMDFEKKRWTTKFVNDLPDSSFAIILTGGKKDKEGKTVPRSLRKLPFKDPKGKIDISHLRNALARVSNVDAPEAARKKAQKMLEKELEKYKREQEKKNK